MNNIEVMLRELGRARRDIGIRARRRHQISEVLRFLGYIAVAGIVTAILLSL